MLLLVSTLALNFHELFPLQKNRLKGSAGGTGLAGLAGLAGLIGLAVLIGQAGLAGLSNVRTKIGRCIGEQVRRENRQIDE